MFMYMYTYHIVFWLYISDYESYSYSFPGYLIAVMVVSILFIIGIMVAVVVCRIYRQRSFMSMASRAHQPNQPQFSPYPTVQYSSSPQPAANLYPGAAGYPPPSGYGVQPPGTGYSTSQPVATGHIYQSFTDSSSQPSGILCLHVYIHVIRQIGYCMGVTS